MRTMMLSTGFLALLAVTVTADTPDPKAKKALQDIGEFVGQWNLTADSKAGGKTVSWKETVSIAWKFKGDDSWLAVELKNDKTPRSGDLRYDVKEKKYTLKLVDKDKKETLYTGEFKKGKLAFESKDAASKDVHKLTFSTAAEGIRMTLLAEIAKDGGLAETVYKATGNKDGESLAGSGSKKPECIVTGGTASISVTYNGKTYYVCCTGCRDEFNANPKKYVDAAEKKK